jgi:hypothetical protein
MKIQELSEALAAYGHRLLDANPATAVKCLKILSEDLNARREDLVVGRAEDFIRLGVPTECKNIACVGDTSNAAEFLRLSGVNGLLFSGHPDMIVLCNEISEVLVGASELERSAELLFRTVYKRSSATPVDVDKLIDVAYELLNNPIVIFSSSGTVMAYRNLDSVCPEILENYNFDKLTEDFRQASDGQPLASPVVIEGFLGKPIRAMTGAIVVSGRCVAHCMLLEYVPFNKSTETLLSLTCSWIAQEAKLGAIEFSGNNTSASKFFSYLIENQTVDEKVIRKNAELLGFGKKRYYYLIVIDTSMMGIAHGSPHSLKKLLEHRIPGIVVTIVGYYIAMLRNTDEPRAIDALPSFLANGFLSSFDVCAGISYRFCDLSRIAGAYQQALRAMEIGRQLDAKGKLFTYDDFALLHMISICKQSENLWQFCLPEIMDLIEHDRVHGTQYLYTLYMLIVSGGKQTLAAKSLNIHRTTMQYRIEKISERLGFDINDPYYIIRVYLTIGILVYDRVLDSEQYYQI